MSGTSADGADYALCRISGKSIDLIHHWYAPYPLGLKKLVLDAAENRLKSHDLSMLHHRLGRFYAGHTDPIIQNKKIDVVGLHGQTVHHRIDRGMQTTMQIGDPAWLCATLGVPVVHQFRNHDVCLGGQGAPLATLFHFLLFGEKKKHVCVQNLGGIGNVTSIDWTEVGSSPKFLAFDTGPAHMLIASFTRFWTKDRKSFDKNGALASRGKVHPEVVKRLLKLDSFIRKPPPKSTGRERYGDLFFKSCMEEMETFSLAPNDQIATLTRFTARSIAENVRLHLPKTVHRMILAGGGSKNPILVRDIKDCMLQLSGIECRVEKTEDRDWKVESIEAAAFALLACCRMDRVPGNIHNTTGASRACLLGSVSEMN